MTRQANSTTLPTIVALILSTFAVCAEELPSPSGAFHAISVRSVAETSAWYVNHLGFEVVSEGANEERKGVLLRRSNTLLELAEFGDSIDREELLQGLEAWNVYGIFKLGFLTGELEATYEFLEEEGVEIFFPIVTTPDGGRTFAVKDIDGNIIQFFEDSSDHALVPRHSSD